MTNVFLTPSYVFCKKLQGCDKVQVIERRLWDRTGRSPAHPLKRIHHGGPLTNSLQFKDVLHIPETQNWMHYLGMVSKVPREGQSLNFPALLAKPRLLLAFVTAGTHCSLKFSKVFARPQTRFHRAAPVKPSQGNPRGSSLSLRQDCGFVPAELQEIAVSCWHVGSVTCSPPPPSEHSQPFSHQAAVDPLLMPYPGYQDVVEDGVSHPLGFYENHC